MEKHYATIWESIADAVGDSEAIVVPVTVKVFGFDLPVTLPRMTAFDLAEAPVSAPYPKPVPGNCTQSI